MTTEQKGTLGIRPAPATEPLDLNQYLNEKFIKNKHGKKTVVELLSVKNRNVIVRAPERADSLTLPKATFLKEYVPIKLKVPTNA